MTMLGATEVRCQGASDADVVDRGIEDRWRLGEGHRG